jgi:periplasmic divalent cation tolerance protein
MVTIIYTTINDEQYARKIASFLIQEQIVACVNIIPKVESIYRWKGKIEEEIELILIAKTVDENVKKAINRIKELHKYETPDIVAIPVIDGNDDYLDYIKRETE